MDGVSGINTAISGRAAGEPFIPQLAAKLGKMIQDFSLYTY
jgi:hypothetical protein